MRRFAEPRAAFGVLTVALVACGGFSTSAAPGRGDGGGATSTGAGLEGQGGGGGINTNLGGSMKPGAFDYSALCGEGCVPGEACSDAGAGGAGGAGGGGPMACQLVLDETYREVVGACSAVGEALADMPCLDSSDCAPGLGCVDPGVCRQYCCSDLGSCEGDTYCAPQLMVAGDLPAETTAPTIPVCVKVDDCVLLDDTTCSDGKTCTVVKSDGTVSCVVPGAGEADDACPCAAGHACKPEINTCFQLCRLDRPDDCPTTHTCQGGVSMYPEGFGVCVAN